MEVPCEPVRVGSREEIELPPGPGAAIDTRGEALPVVEAGDARSEPSQLEAPKARQDASERVESSLKRAASLDFLAMECPIVAALRPVLQWIVSIAPIQNADSAASRPGDPYW